MKSGETEPITVSVESACCASTTCGGERATIIRRGMMLQYVTIGYNCIEAVLAITSGMLAGSIALVGFGIDSTIEVTSGLAAILRLKADGHTRWHQLVEKYSLRVIGVCFLALAAYISCESLQSLLHKTAPERSLFGVIIAALSLIIMPWLARAKRKVARSLGSMALEADSKQTVFCTYLSAILLAGVGLNAAFGCWWADPAAALIMVPIILKEGVLALQGKDCCSGGSCPSSIGSTVAPLKPNQRG